MRHKDLIHRMTLEEKASLVSGLDFWNTKPIERLGIRSLLVADGPHGLRKQNEDPDHVGLNPSNPATCFPTAATLANSWDPDLLYEVGRAVATEAAAEHVHVLLGPGLNIKRNPLGGRNFEYFSEDPYLTGTLASAFVRGVQSVGVGASPKHFAVNSQEKYRMSVDEVVDERALHEIYLEAFRQVVADANPWMLMTSYNRVNGTFAHEHPHLIADTLRGEWSYDGTVVSDWGGNNDGVAAAAAGSNLEMPSSAGITEDRVLQAVRAGELPEAVLDDRIDEFLTLLDRISAPFPDEAVVDFDDQHRLARRAAEESIVLLENTDGALPLKSGTRVAVVGTFAKVPRFQGEGSSLVNPTRVSCALDALRQRDLQIVGFEPGFKGGDTPSTRLSNKASSLASKADVTLLFLGLDEGAESEGFDREHMRLGRNQLALAHRLIREGNRVIVVLAGGAPVELPFAPHVAALVHSYLPGQAGGQAIANVLTGQVNPSGKLTESYPLTYEDSASSPEFGRFDASAEHRESLYVGYRYFDKVGLPVRYPFGFGLSYTTFAYSDAYFPNADDPFTVRLAVKNTGDRAGSEVVEVYTQSSQSDHEFRPRRELAGFTKVRLAPGESKQVEVHLRDHAYSYFDIESHSWEQAGGDYQVLIGTSSRDVSLVLNTHIDGPSIPTYAELPTYTLGHVQDVPDAEFEKLLGYRPPPRDLDMTSPLTEESILAQLPGHSALATIAFNALHALASLSDRIDKTTVASYLRLLPTFPLSSLSRMTSGKVSPAQLNIAISALNGETTVTSLFLRWLRGMLVPRNAKRRHLEGPQRH